MAEETITAAWGSERLGALSRFLVHPTAVVLDNERAQIKAVKGREALWQEPGLFVAFLPLYSSHLNIAETLWRKLMYERLRPEDYSESITLTEPIAAGKGNQGK